MIQNLRIEGFKNFQKVDIELGPWNLFIGANASGKSNLLEVLRIFQGIALGYRIDEIFDGKPKSARGDTWEGIRGGLANAGFLGQDLMSFGIGGLAPAPFSYDIKISSRHGSNEEKLSLKGEPVFEYAANIGATLLRLASKKPGLPAPLENLPSQISNTVKLDPSPAILRGYSAPKEVRQMGGTRGKFRWR